jgi:hypothetical protein
MEAFVVERYGKDGPRAAGAPEPKVGERDVLVKVSAAAINPLDTMVRDGEFKRLLKYRAPFALGHDVAGVVSQVGSVVRGFQAGDEVFGRPRDLRIGTFAEYIAIDEDDVALKPASLTLHEAAAVPLVSLAAWQALVDRAHVQPGQKVLVHAGSGGLGSTVIQLAKHLGATVATTAREVWATRSCSCRPKAGSCASWPASTTPATRVRSSTRHSHSTRPSRRWRTSSRAARGKVTSRWTDIAGTSRSGLSYDAACRNLDALVQTVTLSACFQLRSPPRRVS